MDKQNNKGGSRQTSAGTSRPQHESNKPSKAQQLNMPPTAAKEDIKTSIEKQRLANKKKFEDPFFIKIDAFSQDGESHNMKIVKKAKDPADDENNDYDKESVSSGDDEQHVNKRKGTGDTSKYATQLKDSNTVAEANEDDECSPTVSRGKSKTKLKNMHVKEKTKMSEISQDDFEKVSAYDFKPMPALVKLDLNLDNLKGYLEDYQIAINDHGQLIQIIQQELKRKANEKTVASHLLKISEGLHKECGERPHAFRLDEQNNMSDHFLTDDSILLKRNAEKLQEKFEIIGLNLIGLSKFKVESLEKIEHIERELPKCFTIDMFREESQAQESRIMKHITEQLGTFQENQNNHKKELVEGLTFFEKKVNEHQQQTLWRIQDCEELLKSRVSDKYVNDSVKTMDEKLSKNIQFNESKQIERLEKAFKELGQRIVQTNSFLNEKFDDSRKMLQQYDQKLSNVATIDKVLSVQSGYKDMKYNLERELELIQEHVKEVKDKIGELNRRFINLELASFADMPPSYNQAPATHNTGATHHNQHQQKQLQHSQQQQQQQQPDQQNPSSPVMGLHSRNHSNHQQTSDKLSHRTNTNYKSPSGKDHQGLSSSPTTLSPMLRKRNQQNNAAAAELERKMAVYEDLLQGVEVRMDQLKKLLDDKASYNDLKKMTADKLSRDEIATLMPNEELSQEKMRYLIKEEIESVQKAFSEQLKNWDSKIVKLRNDLDIHSITKTIDKKANEDQVRNDFSNHEFKISTLDRNLIRMASDFEMFQLAINKLHGAIVELQEANRDVLIGKKAVNCLSCGKGGDSNQTMKGKDGRMYRADGGGAGGGLKLFTDDTHIPSAQQLLHDQIGQNQYNSSGYINESSQNQFSDYKTKQQHSYYDNNDIQNLPSVSRKNQNSTSSYGNFGVKSSTGSIQGQASQGQINTSLVQQKKKLPFGFQVQQEKKELFKVGRGKSGHGQQRQRLEPMGYQNEINTTFDN